MILSYTANSLFRFTHILETSTHKCESNIENRGVHYFPRSCTDHDSTRGSGQEVWKFQTLPGRVGLGHEVVRTLTGWNGSSQEAFKSYGLVRVTLTRLDPREVIRPVNSPAIFAPEPFGGGESQRAPHTPHANGVKGVTSRKQHPTDVVVVEVRLPGAVTSTHDAVKTIPRKRKSLLTEAERHIDVR